MLKQTKISQYRQKRFIGHDIVGASLFTLPILFFIYESERKKILTKRGIIYWIALIFFAGAYLLIKNFGIIMR